MGGRIVIVHYTSPSYAGGVETAIGDFVRMALKQGREVLLLVGKGEAAELASHNFHRIDLMDADHPDIARANEQIAQGASATDEELRLRAILCSIIRPGDEVHAHNIVCNTFNLPLARALNWLVTTINITLVAWCWDPVWTSTSPDNLSSAVVDLTCKAWPRTIYISLTEARERAMNALGSFPVAQMRRFWPYIDLARVLSLTPVAANLSEQHKLLQADLVVAYPCRIARRKNIEATLRLIRIIKDKQSHPVLILGGFVSPHRQVISRTYRDDLVQVANSLGVAENVVWLDEYRPEPSISTGLTSQDVVSLLRLCDVFFSPSLDEGFGLGVIEAAANAIAVVASPESTPELNGLKTVYRVPSTETLLQAADAVTEASADRKARRLLLGKYSSTQYLAELKEILSETIS